MTETLTAVQASKVKFRIRAILAKTTANGCTPEEAESAAAKAQAMLVKYGWTMADVAKAQPQAKAQPKPEPQPEPKPAKKAAKAKPQAAGAKRRGPAPEFADEQVIEVLVKNPKRPGSMAHARYAKYRTGMTVRQALDAGLRREDFKWDTDHGHIDIK